MRLSLFQATQALQNGQVVAVPTETVYGLAASLKHPTAIEAIFALKGRPLANPLIVHIGDLQELQDFVETYPPHFDELASSFWPGPLTMILPVNSSIPLLVRAGLPTAGFRIPSEPATLKLLKSTGPLVMPSANLSGKPSATRPEHVEEDFGVDFPILQGGICKNGLESTILFFQENMWVVVRLGAIPSRVFEHILGYQPQLIHQKTKDKPLCPGQLFRHYAPRARLLLGDSMELKDVQHVLGFLERSYPKGKRVFILGSMMNPSQVAENLYHILRQLDHEQIDQAWVDMDFPREGLWQTIAERLVRAGER